MKLKIELTRIILDTYNIIPDSYILSEKVPDLRLKQMLLEIEKKNPQLLDFLIKPESVSYASIPLALLLCGQAYYYEENGELTRICDPILSTYELIWEYAVRLSWDTFYATRIDISQAGLSPKPPYTKVTMGYPPKPNEFSLKEEHIKEWVTAKEHYECGGYPFYPEKDSENWKNKQLDHVVAPYPYIPLSCL
ncbi:hypothetical protein [Aphanothece sacrum]|uniref:Uncharacterized protein n=2 Tax=Aphanothece sacrum TaxID=1122 RepID=A0A401IKQ1_APHSA|nr:hypothetical protein [Aphanothece sacrum]GBF81827.1 hypothetical protein AsFPU1_3248 [Aphanothece sacrum FPU1]